MSKSAFIIVIVLVSVMVATPMAFATSGECSYHGGVNCSAGPSSQGYAVCNDGWTSSVLYSQTDECRASCIAPADVASEVQTIQQDANQIIQIIQNGYSAILSEDSALIATCQTSMNAQAAGRGLMGSPTGASMISQCSNNTQYTLDQSKEQLAISQEQMKADAQKQAIENEQCAAPIAPVCPVGASLSGTTCVCGTGRAMWDNICISQAMYNSINCSQTYGTNYDYSTSTNSCVIKEPQCQAGYAPINGACWQIVTSKPATVPSVNNNATANASAAPTTNTTPSTSLITKNLSIGSSGNNVSILQGFLESGGYLTLPIGTADGYFGNLTKQALITFQKSANLPATGYCGPMTRAAISNNQ